MPALSKSPSNWVEIFSVPLAGNGQKLPLTESSDGIFVVPGELIISYGLGESGSIIYHFDEEGAALKQVTILWNDRRKPADPPENGVYPPA